MIFHIYIFLSRFPFEVCRPAVSVHFDFKRWKDSFASHELNMSGWRCFKQDWIDRRSPLCQLIGAFFSHSPKIQISVVNFVV